MHAGPRALCEPLRLTIVVARIRIRSSAQQRTHDVGCLERGADDVDMEGRASEGVLSVRVRSSANKQVHL